jgi:PAS domain S-box-containing protein
MLVKHLQELTRLWNRQSITVKFSLVFGLLLMFIVFIGVLTLVVLNNVRQRTETSILSATQIQQVILEMNGKLEKARRLQRDFFWRYPQIGFSQARSTYADPALDEIKQVVHLSSHLKELISGSDVSESFQKSNIDVNLYLSASENYASTFQEAVHLTEQLALEGAGWLDQLAANSNHLFTLIEQTGQSSWLDDYQSIQLNEKDYLLSGRPSSMQSILNITIRLRHAIDISASLNPDLKSNILAAMDSHSMLIDKIVQTDAGVRSKLNDFDLQAQSVDPISQLLIALANEEIQLSHQQIEQTSLSAMLSLALMAVMGLGLTSVVAVLLNRSITQKIIHLTRVAEKFQSGNLNIMAPVDSEDELGKLAKTMNSMAVQVQESFSSLQTSETRYRDLFEESPVALWEEDFSALKRQIDQLSENGVKDWQTYFSEHPDLLQTLVNQVVIIDVNRAALDLLKFTKKEDLLKDLANLFTETSYSTFCQEIIALANGMTTFESEITHRTSQGNLVELVLRMNIVPGFEQTWAKILVSLSDITEQRAAALALRESEKRFRIIFNSVNDAIFVHDIASGAIVDVNHTTCEMYGYSVEEILQHDIGFLSANDETFNLQGALHWMNKAATQGPQIFEWKGKHKDGHVFWIEINMRLAVINNQDRLLIVGRGITERKRAEEKIRDLNIELEKRVADRTAQLTAVNKELEAFSYSISHDLRAPLRAMDGFSQALLEDYHGQLDPQAQHYLQRIRANNQHMSRLIDALLNLSRITRSALAISPVDLAAIAREIMKDLCASDPNRSVEFLVAESLIVQADPVLVRVVLANLLGNAFKFTAQHPSARIEFGLIEQNGHPVYFVRDDGAGFDMAYQNKLFGTFQRLHPVTLFEGTGIGLALVQRIIHHHGGQIWAQGAVEQGATFFFTLSEE